MDDRKNALRKALGQDHPSVYQGRTTTATPSRQTYSKGDPRFTSNSSLRRGKVVGRGVFRTRLNWGVIVLVAAFVLFLITQFIIRPMVGG